MKPPRFQRRRVALLIETSNAYARGLLVGITAFMQRHEAWAISLPEQERGALPPRWLAKWRGEGVIARIENEEIAQEVMRLGVPVVDLSAARMVPSVPWVETDDEAIAELVFQHFVERGYRQYAFCGDSRFQWSRWRRDRFVALAAAHGQACHICDEPSPAFIPWLKALPKPIGIMAAYDIRAQQLLVACRDAGISVPEDVAVVGVDNDEIVCDLCSPPLSSVACDTFQTGLQAAQLLHAMMNGEQVAPTGHFLKPLRLVVRESSDGFAIADPHIATAMRMIREHACDGLQVADLLAALPLSRRTLESRFRKCIGRSPHEEILRHKMERVQALLIESDLPLSAIARRTGFAHDEYLSVAFKRVVGIPPSEYRRQQLERFRRES
ncbi:MAG TPA: DNA-binding transcriptional regulator [Pirellulaceae bacterium]|nr:DNA-binding transcriptional regulator [Pirellulaceae bacterium]